jgi:Cu/Zn superoxide dismutase
MNTRHALLTALTASLIAAAIAAGPVQADGTHGRSLSAVMGQGAGIVNVTTTAGSVGDSMEISVNVHGTTPNTTFYIQRAPEVGRPLGSDGICQRANGLWPWEQPNSAGYPAAPAFVTFPRPLAGDLKTLTTDADGAGSAHFAFDLPTLADGTVFDVEFRLVDSLMAPTTDLRTGCFTVTVR